MSPVLGLEGPESQALQCQAPLEGPLRGQPRVMGNPLEEGRPLLPALRRAEGWAEVRALRSGSVGSSVLDGGAFEGHRGLGESCPFSCAE